MVTEGVCGEEAAYHALLRMTDCGAGCVSGVSREDDSGAYPVKDNSVNLPHPNRSETEQLFLAYPWSVKPRFVCHDPRKVYNYPIYRVFYG